MIESDESPPPESKLNTPKKESPSKNCVRRKGSAPGIGILDKRRKINRIKITKSILLRNALSLNIFPDVLIKVFINFYFIVPLAFIIASFAEFEKLKPESFTDLVIEPVPSIFTVGTLPF